MVAVFSIRTGCPAAIDADRRVACLDRDGHPGGQPAAADRDRDRAHVRALLEDLQPDRALAGDHVRVVEGVDVDAAVLFPVCDRGAHGVLDAGAVQHDVGPVAAGRRDLGQRGRLRHEHRGLDAERRGGEGDALGVIARAGHHHAPGPVLLGQPGQPGEPAAGLERPGALQVLALQVHRAADLLGQHPGVQQRRGRDRAPHQLAGGGHIVGADGEGRHGSSVASGARRQGGPITPLA
jgi:hypothetical protein